MPFVLALPTCSCELRPEDAYAHARYYRQSHSCQSGSPGRRSYGVLSSVGNIMYTFFLSRGWRRKVPKTVNLARTVGFEICSGSWSGAPLPPLPCRVSFMDEHLSAHAHERLNLNDDWDLGQVSSWVKRVPRQGIDDFTVPSEKYASLVGEKSIVEISCREGHPHFDDRPIWDKDDILTVGEHMLSIFWRGGKLITGRAGRHQTAEHPAPRRLDGSGRQLRAISGTGYVPD